MRIIVILLASVFFACNSEKSNTKLEDLEAKLEFKYKAQLGEGAFWNHRDQNLYWVDILDNKLHIYDPQTKRNRSLFTSSMVGTVVPATDSTAVIALVDGIYIINTINGKETRLSYVESDTKENRFNDGKCDPLGNLWVGSMHMPETSPNGNLYKVEANGTTSKMKDDITISNGIVWTSNNKTMYYIDTPTLQIKAFDFDPETATITNERVAVQVSREDGFPDGMAIDENDNLWVGLWNGNAVAQYDPLSGALMRKVWVPAHNVTACAFGGENLDILYITTASVDMSVEEIKKFPLAGSIFKVNPGVSGVKSAFFGK
ncbi:MAG: SMP-30/gluconolactonase/LRE family protein [Bacteroidia bacterium]|nr:SMP-30/gluconolactonase/LRE family protein [Bacteroidia bacterium]